MSIPIQNQSPIRVEIGSMFAFNPDEIGIRISMRYEPGESRVLRIEGENQRWELVDENITSGATFRLNNDVARALLDKLLQHYQGASDMHTVRSDLLHERERVDKLIHSYALLATNAIDALEGQ